MRHRSRRTAAALSLALSASLGLVACGDSDDAAGGGGDEATSQSQQGEGAGATGNVSPEAAIDSLTGVSTAVELDQGFLDALSSLGLTPGTVGTATLEGGEISFPITGGAVSYYDPASVATPYVQGVILHSASGLSLSAGGTTVSLSNFIVDPAQSILYGTAMVDGDTAAMSVPLFFLDGSTLEPLSQQGDTAVLQGTTVKLHPQAAALLRQTFMTDMVPDYLTIGTATITLALGAPSGS